MQLRMTFVGSSWVATYGGTRGFLSMVLLLPFTTPVHGPELRFQAFSLIRVEASSLGVEAFSIELRVGAFSFQMCLHVPKAISLRP